MRWLCLVCNALMRAMADGVRFTHALSLKAKGIHALALCVLCGFSALSGCATSTKTQTPRTANYRPRPAVEPLNRPAGESRSARVQAGVLPLGAIPYDDASLPLVSPDGQFIATQAGESPSDETIRAHRDAAIPIGTAIDIYHHTFPAQSTEQPLRLIASVNEPGLLGRFGDEDGFLIESPRTNGSRWIGKAAWPTGEVEWLISDENVNAFAGLGPSGELAWSRRGIDDDHFDLVVSRAGQQWSIRSDGDDWLLPTFSSDGQSLFVLHLDEHGLELRYGPASDAAAFEHSMQRLRLRSDGSVAMAYQTMAGQTPGVATSGSEHDELLFYHPLHGRVSLWRPLAPWGKKETRLINGSIAALIDEHNDALIAVSADRDSLTRVSLDDPRDRIELIADVQIPRPTTSPTWPYILLSPREGQVVVTAMRFVAANEPAAIGDAAAK